MSNIILAEGIFFAFVSRAMAEAISIIDDRSLSCRNDRRWPGSSRSMVDLQLAVDIASSMSNRAVRKTPGECHRRHMWSYTHDPYCMLQANLFSMKQCWNDVIFTIHEIMHPR